MQVVQRTATKLILQARPLGIWLLGSFVAVLGLLIFISYESPVDFFGACCIVVADLAVLFAPVETCAFDKALDRVALKRQGWMGTEVTERLIHKIADVEVEKFVFLGTSFYRVTLVLVSGLRLDLNRFPSTDLKKQREMASYIRRFLKLYSGQPQTNARR